jgi:hypothetical protein
MFTLTYIVFDLHDKLIAAINEAATDPKVPIGKIKIITPICLRSSYHHDLVNTLHIYALSEHLHSPKGN